MRAVDGKEVSCKVISFSENEVARRRSVDKWLDAKVEEKYDKDGSAAKNPTLRLLTLYDLLEGKAKGEFYSYVRQIAESISGERAKREQFWGFMTMASDAWNDMEEFGKQLAVKSKAYKTKSDFLYEDSLNVQ